MPLAWCRSPLPRYHYRYHRRVLRPVLFALAVPWLSVVRQGCAVVVRVSAGVGLEAVPFALVLACFARCPAALCRVCARRCVGFEAGTLCPGPALLYPMPYVGRRMVYLCDLQGSRLVMRTLARPGCPCPMQPSSRAVYVCILALCGRGRPWLLLDALWCCAAFLCFGG